MDTEGVLNFLFFHTEVSDKMSFFPDSQTDGRQLTGWQDNKPANNEC